MRSSSSSSSTAGSGDLHPHSKHHLLIFHLLHLIMHAKNKDNSHHHQVTAAVQPKGCMVVRVGLQGEEEPQRFVVPVAYLNHPLFARLLKEAEEEYGFDHKGAITIPCHVEHFRHVRGMIDREASAGGGHGHGHQHHHHQSQYFHLPLSSCFRA